MKLVVAGLVRRGDEVLLVQQQGPGDPEPSWALPGGVVEPGELLTEALEREVQEETGLGITDPGRLLYVVQLDWPQEEQQYTAVIFEVAGWQGELRPDDPDGLVREARFFSAPGAIDCLKNHAPWMKGRTIAYLQDYLRGEVPPGAVWCYRRQPDGTDVLVSRVAES